LAAPVAFSVAVTFGSGSSHGDPESKPLFYGQSHIYGTVFGLGPPENLGATVALLTSSGLNQTDTQRTKSDMTNTKFWRSKRGIH